MTTAIPGDDGGDTRRVVVDGRTTENDEIAIQSIAMSPQLFDVAGPAADRRPHLHRHGNAESAADVAVINQGLARRLWPGDSPLDRRIGFRGGRDIDWFRVVGVVPDIHYEEVGEETEQSRLNVYLPYATQRLAFDGAAGARIGIAGRPRRAGTRGAAAAGRGVPDLSRDDI